MFCNKNVEVLEEKLLKFSVVSQKAFVAWTLGICISNVNKSNSKKIVYSRLTLSIEFDLNYV